MLELKFAIYYRAASLPSPASYAVLAEESQAFFKLSLNTNSISNSAILCNIWFEHIYFVMMNTHHQTLDSYQLYPPRLVGHGRLGPQPRDPSRSSGALTMGRAAGVGDRLWWGVRCLTPMSAVSILLILDDGDTGMNGKLYFNSMDKLTLLSFSALAVPGRLHGYKELANNALE